MTSAATPSISIFTLDYRKVPRYLPQLEGIDCPVLKVVDGDSIVIAAPVEKKYYRWSVRLAGIDTPELRSPFKEERVKAKQAKNQLIKLIGSTRHVLVEPLKYDKYGRLLAEVYNMTDEKSLSDQLVELDLAVPYEGGKRMKWC